MFRRSFNNIGVKYQAYLAINETNYVDAWKKEHKTACTSLPEDKYLDVRNKPKTL